MFLCEIVVCYVLRLMCLSWLMGMVVVVLK